MTHLVFANNSLVFFHANHSNTKATKECLSLSEKTPRQSINLEKPESFFDKDTRPHIKDSVCSILVVKIIDDNKKYVGLPSLIWCKKKEIFAFVKEKLLSYIGRLKKQNLS